MKKSILEVYTLAVCYGAIVCFAVGFGIALYSIVRIANPEVTMCSYKYNSHQSNDAFWEDQRWRLGSCEKCAPKMKKPPEEELTKQRLASYQRELKLERRNGYQQFVIASIITIISTIIFLIHWLMARKIRKTIVAT